MSRDQRVWLTDIVEACSRIQLYVADLDEAGFRGDRKTFDAVVRNLDYCSGKRDGASALQAEHGVGGIAESAGVGKLVLPYARVRASRRLPSRSFIFDIGT